MINDQLNQRFKTIIAQYQKLCEIKFSKGVFQMPVISMIVYVFVFVDTLWWVRDWWLPKPMVMTPMVWIFVIGFHLLFLLALYRWYLTIRINRKQTEVVNDLSQTLNQFTKADWIDLYQGNQLEYLKDVAKYLQLQERTDLKQVQYEYQNQEITKDLARSKQAYQDVIQYLKKLCPYDFDWQTYDTRQMRTYVAKGNVYNLQKWV